MGKNKEGLSLVDARMGEEYIIREIQTGDEELDSFLFSLGCYTGEPIVVVSRVSDSYVVAIKDGRYNIDRELAETIIL